MIAVAEMEKFAPHLFKQFGSLHNNFRSDVPHVEQNNTAPSATAPNAD